MVSGMTIGEAVKEGTKILTECCNVSWLDASVILGYVLGKERWHLVAHSEEILPTAIVDEYFCLINKRLSGMPVQYITGHQEFMSLNFFVDQSVLIPRPETEILVEEVLRVISTFPKEQIVYIADMGTGSGCIAISIAKSTENTLIKAVDISEEALKVAGKNAQELGVADRIGFMRSDMFENITGESFDIIVSNPPYISSEVIDGLQVEVREYEPNIALDGGRDGLDYYRRIITDGCGYLKPGGKMMFEIGCEQGEAIWELVNKSGYYKDFRIVKDLAGKNRIIDISRKN